MDGGIDARLAASRISEMLYGWAKSCSRMNAARVSSCARGGSAMSRRGAGRGGTSAMVDTGSAGASSSNPSASLEWRGETRLICRCFGPKTGVQRIRTIKNGNPPKCSFVLACNRHSGRGPIGLLQRKNLLQPANHGRFIVGDVGGFPGPHPVSGDLHRIQFAGPVGRVQLVAEPL